MTNPNSSGENALPASTAAIDTSTAAVDSVTSILDLPYSLLLDISAHVSLKECIRFSQTCKQFVDLTRETPFVFIDIDEYMNGVSQEEKETSFHLLDKCLENFFMKRKGFGIKRLSVRCTIPSVRLDNCKWLKDAFLENVEELVLDLNRVGRLFQLPRKSRIFQTVKVLNLTLCLQDLDMSTLLFENLEELTLKRIRLSEDPICKLLSSCLLLKQLTVESCFGYRVFTVKSSGLRTFRYIDPHYTTLRHLTVSCEKLEVLLIEMQSIYDELVSLKLSTPVLQSLNWVGRVPKCVTMKPSGALTYVGINFSSTNQEGDMLHFLEQISSHLRNIKVLNLCNISMQALLQFVNANKEEETNYPGILGMIVDKFSSSDCPEVGGNAAETLCAINWFGPPGSSVKISRPSFMGRLSHHELEASGHRLGTVNSLGVCVSLVYPNSSGPDHVHRCLRRMPSVADNPERVGGTSKTLAHLVYAPHEFDTICSKPYSLRANNV